MCWCWAIILLAERARLRKSRVLTHFASNSDYGVILGLDPGIQRTKRMQPAVFWIPAFAGMTVLGEEMS